MNIVVPPLEPRLQRRYQHLVTEHMSPVQAVAAGLRALPGAGTALASTQAAWRFYRNPDVTLDALVAPLIASAREVVDTESERVALIVHDWTELDYHRHARKQDRIEINSAHCLGYRLQSAIVLSDRDGLPIAPLYAGLWAGDGIHTTRGRQVVPDRPHIDEISDVIETVEAMALGRPCVHIIDRGADSVAHYRLWDSRARRFLVRADALPRVDLDGERLSLGAVAERVDLRAADAVEISATVTAVLMVGQTFVTITRPASPHRQRGGVKEKRRMIAGEPLRVRLVVTQLRTPDEQIYAEWLLLTNVDEGVRAETLARWYVWRWRIESYFKLVKGAGHQLEHWQQESAEAITKRLLVTGMASVVVWRLARAQTAEAEAARQLLVRLSGRQMRRDRPFTEPAMLAGLWGLLSTLDTLEHYTVEELRQMARVILPGFARYQKE